MTAEEYLEEMDKSSNDINGIIEKAMVGYARLKCQELLLLIAEKADIRHTFTSAINGKTIHSYDKIFSAESSMFTVDKDSILNAINLEKFCS